MDIFLQAFISYTVIVDPIGVALIFHAMTYGRPEAYRRRMALQAAVISFGLILFFGFFGQRLLGVLGISLDAFKIAGGLLLFYTASSMVVSPESTKDSGAAGEETDISVFPLSIPLLAGPGCLTLTVLMFSGEARQPLEYLYLLGALALLFALTLFCLLASHRVSRLVGETGNSIMKRLLGVLLAALSIQFIAEGIQGFV